MPLESLLAHLRATYSSSIGAEFMHITDAPQRRWLYTRLERAAGNFDFTAQQQRRILAKLSATEGLERYLHTKYTGQKRFSLEGGDSLIRSEERRVGKEGVSTCRSRGWPAH